jgi:hypothetical protein
MAPSGKVVLGGGAAIPDSNGVIFVSEPELSSGVAVGWTAYGRNTNVAAGALTLNVYCIYADA